MPCRQCQERLTGSCPVGLPCSVPPPELLIPSPSPEGRRRGSASGQSHCGDAQEDGKLQRTPGRPQTPGGGRAPSRVGCPCAEDLYRVQISSCGAPLTLFEGQHCRFPVAARGPPASPPHSSPALLRPSPKRVLCVHAGTRRGPSSLSPQRAWSPPPCTSPGNG